MLTEAKHEVVVCRMLVRAELFKQGLSVVRLTGETGESDLALDRDLQQRQQMFTVASGV